MRLEPDLARDILLWIEENLPREAPVYAVPIPNVDEQLVAYNLMLLAEAGWVSSIKVGTKDQLFDLHLPQRLTFRGHEYAATIRDSEVWAKTKAGVTKLGGIGVEALGQLAKGFLKTKVAQLTGIEIEI